MRASPSTQRQITAADLGIPDQGPTIDRGVEQIAPDAVAPNNTWGTVRNINRPVTFEENFSGPPTVIATGHGGLMAKGLLAANDVTTKGFELQYKQLATDDSQTEYPAYWIAVGN